MSRKLSGPAGVDNLRDIDEEALEWMVRLTSGSVSEADAARFDAWREHPSHARAYERAALLWRSLGPILSAHDVDAGPVESTPAVAAFSAANDNRSSWRRWGSGIAAGLALFLGLSYQYEHVWQFDHVSGAAHATTATFADGSEVVMGPGTAFNSNFDGKNRIVRLARGEAFFDVTRNPDRPFIVEAGGGEVRVLGTAFSVRKAADDSVEVVVARGKVGVTYGSSRAVLLPDRSVRFSVGRFGPVRAVDASLATAWMRGRLIMENAPLDEVLDELNRYSSRRIVLINDEAGRRRVNVVVDLDGIDGWLTALGTSQKLAVNRVGPVVLIR